MISDSENKLLDAIQNRAVLAMGDVAPQTNGFSGCCCLIPSLTLGYFQTPQLSMPEFSYQEKEKLSSLKDLIRGPRRASGKQQLENSDLFLVSLNLRQGQTSEGMVDFNVGPLSPGTQRIVLHQWKPVSGSYVYVDVSTCVYAHTCDLLCQSLGVSYCMSGTQGSLPGLELHQEG